MLQKRWPASFNATMPPNNLVDNIVKPKDVPKESATSKPSEISPVTHEYKRICAAPSCQATVSRKPPITRNVSIGANSDIANVLTAAKHAIGTRLAPGEQAEN